MATAARLRTFRMFPPANHTVFTVQRGATFDATSSGYVDVLAPDADALQHAGWTRVVEIGTTANRPLPGLSSDIPGHIINVSAGYVYFDTSLGKTVFYSPSKKGWVDETHTSA